MRRVGAGLAVALLALALYLLLWPVAIDPVAFHPDPIPPAAGDYAPNSRLAAVERLTPVGRGPEDVARGADGRFYTGLQDGRIVRFAPGGGPVETLVNTGGRPLGMQLAADGRLIVADAFRGLLAVDAGGSVEVLADRVAGRRLLFADDLDLGANGEVWFSDASRRFDQHHWRNDFLEMRATGSLLRHDPVTGATEVRLDGLYFANGVALAADESFVLVAESGAARITRLWLSGPRAGRSETFLGSLPGYPDNLSRGPDGLFWIALASPRLSGLEALWPHPFARRVLARIPQSWLGIEPLAHGWVLAVDASGRVVHNLQDPAGGFSPINSVNRYGDELLLGSLEESSVGRLPAPPAG